MEMHTQVCIWHMASSYSVAVVSSSSMLPCLQPQRSPYLVLSVMSHLPQGRSCTLKHHFGQMAAVEAGSQAPWLPGWQMNQAYPKLVAGCRGFLIQSARWVTVVVEVVNYCPSSVVVRQWRSAGLHNPSFGTKLCGVIEPTGSQYQSGQTISSSFIVHPCPPYHHPPHPQHSATPSEHKNTMTAKG